MSKWTKWVEIECAANLKNGPMNKYGIYHIRMVNTRDNPIPIGRLAKTDTLGILYVGRSGKRGKDRTVAKRIREFLQEKHSGGKTYARAEKVLRRLSKLKNHRLQVRASFLPDNEINTAESRVIGNYFSMYAELPPCNSSMPRG